MGTTLYGVAHDLAVRSAAAHAARCAALAGGWRDWTAGEVITHNDLRAGNAIVDGQRATLIDWSHCAAGPRWLDRALLVADILAAGRALPAIQSCHD